MRTFTIGEVLNRLKDEFDDVTISKIRFLESEGLIHPDRTDSGYRKFTDDDVERLRYILRSQRDRYLPLRVIKEELDRLDAGLPIDPPAPPLADETAGGTLLDADGAAPPLASPTGRSSEALDEAPPVLATGPTDVSLSLAELCDVTGLATSEVRQLRDHGLLSDDGDFDGDDLQIARAAAELMALGLEPRHLRMYLQFADREVALYEQLVTPLLRQRNPDSRATATTQLDGLARNGARLHRSLLARQLRALLRS